MTTNVRHDRKPAPALCPKCGTARLHRSRSTSRAEEWRKKYSPKRPFSCQECGWRGWIDEAHLRYPMKVPGMQKLKVAGKDVPIPEIDLDVSVRTSRAQHPEQAESKLDGTQYGTGKASLDRSSLSGDGREDPVLGPASAASESARREIEVEDVQYISSITGEGTRPFTSKVPDDFHRHAGNKASACPACGGYSLYRSHTRTWMESLRKSLTSKRPYRCHKCTWRGWIQKGF